MSSITIQGATDEDAASYTVLAILSENRAIVNYGGLAVLVDRLSTGWEISVVPPNAKEKSILSMTIAENTGFDKTVVAVAPPEPPEAG